jgi:hypothetical protein
LPSNGFINQLAFTRQSQHAPGQRDVLPHSEKGQQAPALQHEPQALRADIGHLRLAIAMQQRGHVLAVSITQAELSEVFWTQDQADHFQQGAFAAATGPGNRRHLAAPQGQVWQGDLVIGTPTDTHVFNVQHDLR